MNAPTDPVTPLITELLRRPRDARMLGGHRA
jgi:hypothetical protein